MDIIAFKYGDSLFDTKKIFHEDKRHDFIPFAWMFYVIRTNNKTVLVDGGFSNESYLEPYQIKNYINPLTLLKQHHIHPDEITDLIITHAHWDHSDNIGRFRNATIYIQSHEFKELNQRMDTSGLNSRVVLFDDTVEVKGTGVHAVKIGGHTAGSSIVKIKTSKGDVVITGDEVYLYKNILHCIPIGIHYNLEKNFSFIHGFNKCFDNVLTLHDPSIVKANERYRIFTY